MNRLFSRRRRITAADEAAMERAAAKRERRAARNMLHPILVPFPTAHPGALLARGEVRRRKAAERKAAKRARPTSATAARVRRKVLRKGRRK
jgi:hypothetical protein